MEDEANQEECSQNGGARSYPQKKPPCGHLSQSRSATESHSIIRSQSRITEKASPNSTRSHLLPPFNLSLYLYDVLLLLRKISSSSSSSLIIIRDRIWAKSNHQHRQQCDPRDPCDESTNIKTNQKPSERHATTRRPLGLGPSRKQGLATVALWLPLLALLLMGRLDLENHDKLVTAPNDQFSLASRLINTMDPTHHLGLLSQLLIKWPIFISFVRVPWDRLELFSFVGPKLSGCEAHSYGGKVTQIHNNHHLPMTTLHHQHQLQEPTLDRQDLTQEESNMLLLNPDGAESSASPQVAASQRGHLSGYHQQASYARGQQQQLAADQTHAAYADPGQTYALEGGGSMPAEYGAAGDSLALEQQQAAAAGQLQSEATDHHAAARQRTANLATSNGAASAALQARADLPGVSALNVKCEKNHMKVNIVFDRPFQGVVFSKGHYNNKGCIHLPAGSGVTTVNFDIHMGKCGMQRSDASSSMGAGGMITDGSQSSDSLQSHNNNNGQQPHGIYIENTIIIQYDSQVQEIYDQARKLRCTWYDYYEKSVTFRPYEVDMLDAVTANFLGDNIQCWMQIQVGKGPWSSEVAGLVKIGQTMTMVLAIKDDENRFDMLVRNCVAHDGKHAPIQLVDEYGCVARPKIMGQFQKVRNFGPQATVVSYAHFQAFKFPDSMSVHFQCVIQVCRYECPPLNCQDYAGSNPSLAPNSINPASHHSSGNSQTLGVGMGVGPSSSAADYATSGTEMVAIKEQMPTGLLAPHPLSSTSATSYGSPLMPMNGTNNHQLASSGYHQIKLDESLGRVQVKLDTSGRYHQGPVVGSQAPTGGAMPPSLSSTAGSSSSPASPGSASSSATPMNGFQLPRGHAHRYQTNGASAAPLSPLISSDQRSPPSLTTNAYKPSYGNSLMSSSSPAGSRVSMLSGGGGSSAGVALPSAQRGPQVAHYSPQYPVGSMAAAAASLVHRAAYATNRIGELAPGARSMKLDSDNVNNNNIDNQAQMDSAASSTRSFEPEPTGSALSLMATPRALKSSPHGSDYETAASLNEQEFYHENPHRRNKRSTPTSSKANQQQSTNIQTQKTIQVISPEDVAFSLGLGGELLASEDSLANNNQQMSSSDKQPRMQMNDPSGTLCFSAARFLVGLLFALSLLVISFVVAAILLFKQQASSRKSILRNCSSSGFLVSRDKASPTDQDHDEEPSQPSPFHLISGHSSLAGSNLNYAKQLNGEPDFMFPMNQHSLADKNTNPPNNNNGRRRPAHLINRIYSQFSPGAAGCR